MLKIGSILYTELSFIAEGVGNCGWQVILISSILAITIFLIAYSMYKLMPEDSIFEACNQNLGPVISKIFMALMIIYLSFYCSVRLREGVEILDSYEYDITPKYLLTTVILIASAVSASVGLRGISGLSIIFIYPIIIGIASIFILGYQHYEVNNIFPILGNGFSTTLMYGLKRTSLFADIMIVFILASHIKDKNIVKKAGLSSLLYCGILFAVSSLLYIFAFNYKSAISSLCGMLAMAKNISMSQYVQRIEGIIILIFGVSLTISTSILTFVITELAKGLFENGKSKYRDFIYVILITGIVFVLTIYPYSLPKYTHTTLKFVRDYHGYFIFGIFIFIITLSFARLRYRLNYKQIKSIE